MLPVLLFPQFDPVLVHLGPLAIRWYALSYIVGIVLGVSLLRRLVPLAPRAATTEQADDFLGWVTLGVLLGGRLGYVLFYQPGYYLTHPLSILQVWKGGMSFHGGALGVIVAMALFAWRNKINFLAFADRVTVAVPVGLGLGRIANFINGELWGREAPASLPWAMIFPNAGPIPRHPSELYEALTEGCCSSVSCFLSPAGRACGNVRAFWPGCFWRAMPVRAAFANFSGNRMHFWASCPAG